MAGKKKGGEDHDAPLLGGKADDGPPSLGEVAERLPATAVDVSERFRTAARTMDLERAIEFLPAAIEFADELKKRLSDLVGDDDEGPPPAPARSNKYDVTPEMLAATRARRAKREAHKKAKEMRRDTTLEDVKALQNAKPPLLVRLLGGLPPSKEERAQREREAQQRAVPPERKAARQKVQRLLDQGNFKALAKISGMSEEEIANDVVAWMAPMPPQPHLEDDGTRRTQEKTEPKAEESKSKVVRLPEAELQKRKAAAFAKFKAKRKEQAQKQAAADAAAAAEPLFDGITGRQVLIAPGLVVTKPGTTPTKRGGKNDAAQ